MIRTESEYQEAIKRLKGEKTRMQAQRNKLKKEGLTSSQVRLALEPMESFHLQLEEEVDAYERLRRGDLGEVENLHGLGQMLIGLRIARGVSQAELAARLERDPSQVSRDEKNEYHGITVDRASKILDALRAHLKSRTAEPVLPEGDSEKPRKLAS
ncbi:helix-turn-helix transcriptional regulator [Bdellovibrionota bacterium FG-1]